MGTRTQLPVPLHSSPFHPTMQNTLFQNSFRILAHTNSEAYSHEPDLTDNCNQSYKSFWLRNGYTDTISNLRNTVTDQDLHFLLAVSTQASGVPESHLDHLLAWKIDVDRCAVRFSSRFSAIWVRHETSVVWFCVVDNEFFSFSLSIAEQMEVNPTYAGHAIPHITLPKNGALWSELQQFLVDNFDSDDVVRAISASIMISCNPSGAYTSVPQEMLPEKLRMISTSVIYDVPVDEDMVTVLADPRESNHHLVFHCGGGYWTISNTEGTEATMSRIEQPIKSIQYKERVALLMPFLFR